MQNVGDRGWGLAVEEFEESLGDEFRAVAVIDREQLASAFDERRPRAASHPTLGRREHCPSTVAGIAGITIAGHLLATRAGVTMTFCPTSLNQRITNAFRTNIMVKVAP